MSDLVGNTEDKVFWRHGSLTAFEEGLDVESDMSSVSCIVARLLETKFRNSSELPEQMSSNSR